MRNTSSLRYTHFTVREATTLLPFVEQVLHGISHSKAKAILAASIRKTSSSSTCLSSQATAWKYPSRSHAAN